MINELIFFGLGLIFGSFANVCIYRLPINKSVIGPRSKCINCKKLISWNFNIPVLSYLILKGISKCCKKKISIQYPVVELSTGILFMVSSVYFSLFQSILLSFIIFFIVITIAIDLNKQIIFTFFTYIIFLTGLLVQYFQPDLNPFSVTLKNSLVTTVIAASLFIGLRYIFKTIKGVEALGLGDIYLISSLAIWTGFEKFLYMLIGSSIIGIIFYLIFNTKRNKNFRIPYGSFIGVSFLILLFV